MALKVKNDATYSTWENYCMNIALVLAGVTGTVIWLQSLLYCENVFINGKFLLWNGKYGKLILKFYHKYDKIGKKILGGAIWP